MTISEIAKQHNGRKFGRHGNKTVYFFDVNDLLRADTPILEHISLCSSERLAQDDWEWRETGASTVGRPVINQISTKD